MKNRKPSNINTLQKLLSLCTLLLIFLILSEQKVNAADYKFKYKDYTLNQTIKYNGTIPNYILNGQAINLSKCPAIINENNAAMISATEFIREALGGTCSYSSSKKRLTIKYNGHVLKLYVGKNEGYLDGERIEVNNPPIRIRYRKSGLYTGVTTLIPSRFTASCLGLDYVYDSSTETATIKEPLLITVNNRHTDYNGTRGRMTINEVSVEPADTPSIIISDNALFCARSEVFDEAGIKYTYNEETGEISLIRDDKSIYCCVKSKIAYVNGILVFAPVEPSMVVFEKTGSEYIYLPGRFVFENLGYSYVWNSAEKTSVVSFVNTEAEELMDSVETEGKEKEVADNTDKSDTSAAANDNTYPEFETNNNEPGDLTEIEELQGIKETENMDNEEIPSPESADRKLIRIVNPDDGYVYFVDTEDCGQFIDLPLPEGMTAKDITIEEDFWNRLVQVNIPHDQTALYSSCEFINTGDCILQLRIYYNPEKDRTELCFYSSVVLDASVEDSETEGIAALYIDFTGNMHRKIVVIDAGHGGHDPGAVADKINESDLNLKMLLYLKDYLKDSGIKAYFSRETDVFYSLYDRADIAEMVGADMFISIHHNASSNTSTTGTSVYYSELDTCTSLKGLTSDIMAEYMLKNLVDELETENRGTIAKNFVVVRDSQAPAVLLEIGFMTNKDELHRIAKDSFSKKAAKAIYKTIKQLYSNKGKWE